MLGLLMLSASAHADTPKENLYPPGQNIYAGPAENIFNSPVDPAPVYAAPVYAAPVYAAPVYAADVLLTGPVLEACREELTQSAALPPPPVNAQNDAQPVDAQNDARNPAQMGDIPAVLNPRVTDHLEYFQTRGRKSFTKWLERSPMYMPMIKRILAGENLPEDLAYLALIESGFNPNAYSRAKAVGMWQFISGTAKKYGLKVNSWIDERRDPEKATVAAGRYLKDLYERFDSWLLAAAGYNAGEGKIQKAINKHGTEDFWELASYKKPLKKETKDYIPKYMAARLMAKNPEDFGFTELNYLEPLSYDKAVIEEPTDMKVIAWAAGVTVEEIERLNPELLRWFTPPDYPDYEIKIPAGTREMFFERISQVPKQERLRFHEHKIKKGETLSRIARAYKTDIKQIMYLNKMKSPRYIRVGKTIVVPVRAEGKKSVAARAGGNSPSFGTYKVRKGDSLWKISKRFDIELERLLELNDLKRNTSITPGQTIYLKAALLDKKEDKRELN